MTCGNTARHRSIVWCILELLQNVALCRSLQLTDVLGIRLLHANELQPASHRSDTTQTWLRLCIERISNAYVC